MKRSRSSRSTTGTQSARSSHWANDKGTAFKNPWPSAAVPSWTEAVRKPLPFAQYDQLFSARAKANDRKSVVPDWGKGSLEAQGFDRSEAVIIGTWLGHACALAEIPPMRSEPGKEDIAKSKSVYLLFDPIFSQRAGPTQYTGPSRIFAPPCRIEDLPGCDAVFISHNHYDHLDFETIKSILRKFPKAVFFVPLRNKEWMVSSGVPPELVYELDWWQKQDLEIGEQEPTLSPLLKGSTKDRQTGSTLRITCAPAQHNSGRGVADQGSTLWCGWIVERLKMSHGTQTRKGAIYHAGDTGYRKDSSSNVVCPAFKEIGAYGPFDLSFIPIWRGGTLGFVSYLGLQLSLHDLSSAGHGTPEDAVCIHQDVKSRNTIAVHWGTFVGSENESFEAMVDFQKACDKDGISGLQTSSPGANGRAGTVDYGGSLAVAIQ